MPGSIRPPPAQGDKEAGEARSPAGGEGVVKSFRRNEIKKEIRNVDRGETGGGGGVDRHLRDLWGLQVEIREGSGPGAERSPLYSAYVVSRLCSRNTTE